MRGRSGGEEREGGRQGHPKSRARRTDDAMRPQRNAHRSEKGAVFVQVGISIFVLMAFNVFVLDYGMMWVGRRQAQNAADAGALAGAMARAYDDFGDHPRQPAGAAQSAEQRRRQPTSCGSRRGNAAGPVRLSCGRHRQMRAGRTSIATARTAARRCRHSSARFSASTAKACGRQRRRSSANGNAADCVRP